MTDADTALRAYASTSSAEAFGSFVRATAAPLQRFLIRTVGDPDSVEEIAQRAYIVAARKAATYHGPSPVAWLLGIGFREARSLRREIGRRRSREVDAMDPELSPDVPEGNRATTCGPEELAERREDILRLRAALDRLDSGERVVLELTYLEGLSHSEAAEVLAIPLGTVKSRVHRALEALRRRLAPAGAAPCLALLTPELAGQLGPSLPGNQALLEAAWIREGIRAARAGAAGSAGGATAASAPSAALARSFVAGLLAAGLAAAALVWLVRPSGPEEVAAIGGDRAPAVVAEPIAPPAPEPAAAPAVPVGTPAAPAPAAIPAEEDLGSGVWARGIVLDATGAPMAGVTVSVDDAWDSLEYFPGDPLQTRAFASQFSMPARTGPDGRFVVVFPKKSHTSWHGGGARSGDAYWVLLPPGEYEKLLPRNHRLHLVARASGGETRTVCLETCPASPPEVTVSFAPRGAIRARFVRRPGAPPLFPVPGVPHEGMGLVASFRASSPASYDHFVRASFPATDAGSPTGILERASELVRGAGAYELRDLEPGEWTLHVIDPPPGSVLEPPGPIEVEVRGGETAEVEIAIAPAAGISGTIASPGGYGVAGATARLVGPDGAEVESIALGPTPVPYDSRSGKQIRKGTPGVPATDVSALPTPFAFRSAEAGRSYRIVLDAPGRASEDLGGIAAPRADVALASRSWEPSAKVLFRVAGPHLEGLDLEKVDERAVLFGPGGWTAGYGGPVRAGDDPTPQLWGLPPGDYVLEATQDLGSATRTDGAAACGVAGFRVEAGEEKVVTVDAEPFGRAALRLDPEAWALDEAPGSSAGWRGIYWRAIPIDPRTRERRVDASSRRWGRPVEADGFVPVHLPEGSWAVSLSPDERFSEELRLEAVVLVGIPEPGAEVSIDLPPPSRAVLTVRTDALAAGDLSVAGKTADGLPVDLGPFRGRRGAFEVRGLPAGTYRLTLSDRGRAGAPLVRELRHDGGDRTVEWTEAGAGS